MKISFAKQIKLLIALVCIVCFVNYIQCQFYPILNEVTYETSKLTTNQYFNILQISDLHGEHIKKKSKIFQSLEGKAVDLVVFTGDVIDKNTEDFSGVFDLYFNLVDEFDAPVIFIEGNHELMNKNGLYFIEAIRQAGGEFLKNKVIEVKSHGTRIQIFAIGYSESYNFVKWPENMPGDESVFSLILSHSPQIAMQEVDDKVKNTDLILSGHTHGGSVRIPLIGDIVTPDGFFYPYDKGLYELDDYDLYVDSGYGNSLIPFRLFNRKQLTYIHIKPK